jgi:hypothetical protein
MEDGGVALRAAASIQREEDDFIDYRPPRPQFHEIFLNNSVNKRLGSMATSNLLSN